LLLSRLAAEIRMPAEKLREHLAAAGAAAAGGKRPPRGEPIPPNRSRMSAGRGNLLSQAIALVLHHPTAACAVGDFAALGGIERAGMAVLKELLEQAAAMAQPSTAMLLERWRDRPEYARLSELAMAPAMVAEAEGAAKELQMAVKKLLEAYGPGRRMNELLRKSEEIGLNFEEKAELSSLLKAKVRPGASS